MTVAISKQTNDSLARVMAFFGIDEYNRKLFSKAAESCGVETFARFIGALDTVIQLDSRHGCASRMREAVEKKRSGR